MAALRRTGPALAALLAAATALGGCSAGSGQGQGQGATVSGSAAAGLTIGLLAEPASLDFTKTDGAAIPQALLTNVYEGLVKLDQDGRVVAGLASAWRVSTDRTTYTFDLVPNATFSNGAPFTAEDVKFSIERTKSDWTVSLAKAMAVVKEVKVLSPTQVQVILTKPSNDWLYRMTTRIGAMFSRTGVGELATKPVGTGPFRLESWTKGNALVLRRNDAYWGPKPYFATVTLKYMKDSSALNNALLTGGVDVIGQLGSPDLLAQFQGNDQLQVLEGTTNGEVVLSFNNAAGPFANKLVRQAARAAIDHKALLAKCWGGRGQLIGGMVPPTDPWYEDLTTVAPYDPAQAKSLLAQAGTPNPKIRLRIPTLPYAVSCGQVVQSQLSSAGFAVTLDQLEFPAGWLSTVFKNGDYDASIVAHVEPRDLPAVFGNPDYYLHYKNPAVTTALEAADSGSDGDQIAQMKKAARMVSEDAGADWLFLMPNIVVARKGITGLPKNSISESFDLTTLGRG